MFSIRCSESSEQSAKALRRDFIPRDRRAIAEERERREPRDPSHCGRRTDQKILVFSREEGDALTCAVVARSRVQIAREQTPRRQCTCATTYGVRRTTPRRPTLPSRRRRRHSSSHRSRSDKCAAVAADDVSAILQNDHRLDHPAGRRAARRRLSR